LTNDAIFFKPVYNVGRIARSSLRMRLKSSLWWIGDWPYLLAG